MNKIVICRVLSDKIEEYFAEAPVDYGDRKEGFENLLVGILTMEEKGYEE